MPGQLGPVEAGAAAAVAVADAVVVVEAGAAEGVVGDEKNRAGGIDDVSDANEVARRPAGGS